MSELTADNYIMKFGRYLNMKAVDVAKITKVNPKTGKTSYVGLDYLRFISSQDWYKHKHILDQIIQEHEPEQPEAKAEEKPKETKEVVPKPRNKISD